MPGYIGYTRVSTTKQGREGVSLEVQEAAIKQYAAKHNFPITLWLNEMESAAERGRPVFDQAMKLLRQGKHKGIILHKLDRGARNLRDWTDIGDLSDQGVEIHFVNESLDLRSRGGRLAADIQAVVAADYIRNLREETRKGFYGRLKQGLYPLQAPIGYTDEGKGKAKSIDPIKGPLVRKAFELYSTGEHSLSTLGDALFELGLRSRTGKRVNRSSLSKMLNNPFYFGIIHISKTDERFPGIHEPLIKKSLFDRVQEVIHGKLNVKTKRHFFRYRRHLSCAVCRYSLIGEKQKGHVYYRCHSKQCEATSLREESVESAVSGFIRSIALNDAEIAYLRDRVLQLRTHWADQREDQIRGYELQLSHVKDRMNRLTDALLDQTIDKPVFEERKRKLLLEQKSIEENLSNLVSKNNRSRAILEKFLEPLKWAWLSYALGIPEEKSEMVRVLTSNSEVRQKSLYLKPRIPFGEIAERFANSTCPPQRDIPRTWDRLLDRIYALQEAGQLPDLSKVFRCGKDNITDTESAESVKVAARCKSWFRRKGV